MTLFSLDIGVGRVVTLVAFVRVTPLGPVFAAVERNLEALVDFVAGSLDCSGTRSFTLPLPFSSGSGLSGTGSDTGAGATGSVVAGVAVYEVSSDESCFSGCGSGGAGSCSGVGAGSLEAFEVEGSSGYGSAGIGGSTEADLDLETRREGGVGDLEGSGNDRGFGCGGIRWEGRLIDPGLGSGFDGDGGSGCSCGLGCGKGSGGSRSMESVISLLGRREVGGTSCLNKLGELRGVRGDIGSSNARFFCTSVFGNTSGSRLNGSSFREPEVGATTKAGGG